MLLRPEERHATDLSDPLNLDPTIMINRFNDWLKAENLNQIYFQTVRYSPPLHTSIMLKEGPEPYEGTNKNNKLTFNTKKIYIIVPSSSLWRIWRLTARNFMPNPIDGVVVGHTKLQTDRQTVLVSTWLAWVSKIYSFLRYRFSWESSNEVVLTVHECYCKIRYYTHVLYSKSEVHKIFQIPVGATSQF